MLGIIAMMPAFSAVAAVAIDADEAIRVARSAHCTRCHGVTKEKRGPTYKSIAESYKIKPDAETVLYEHITKLPGDELTDGKKKVHRAIQNRTPEQIRNLARWILNQ